MKRLMKKLEGLLELGGVKKDITLLVISGIALGLSLTNAIKFPFNIVGGYNSLREYIILLKKKTMWNQRKYIHRYLLRD